MGKQIEVIGNADAAGLQAVQSRRVLLAGEPVYTSLQSGVPEGFVPQEHLEAARGLLVQFAKQSAKVHVAVDERLFTLRKVRFAFAIEAYVAWGLARRGKGTTILLGGAQLTDSTSVSIVVLVDGAVAHVDEKRLPAASASYFRDALTTTLDELRASWPGAKVFQAAPLEDWSLPDVEYVGEKALRGLSYRPLTRGSKRISTIMAPAAIVCAGLAFYAGAIGVGWSKYQGAVRAYDEAISDPAIKSQGGIDTNFLNVVNARRLYMDEARRQTMLAEKAAAIVRGAGTVPGVQILEMKLPAPSVTPRNQAGVIFSPEQTAQRRAITADRTPDVWLSIAVPKSQDAALNQARDAMILIANETGMSLRLAHQGWREDQKRRIFNMEGFMHD